MSTVSVDTVLSGHPAALVLQKMLSLPVGRCVYVNLSIHVGMVPHVEVRHFSEDLKSVRQVEYLIHQDGTTTVLVESEFEIAGIAGEFK